MVKEIEEKAKDSDKKKNKIYKLFICGSNRFDSNIKTGSKSSKNKSKPFWKRKYNSSKEEETRYLLEDNNYNSYTDIKKGFKENAIKTKEQKVPKEGKEKEKKKKKSFLKRVRKMALQTCRYISIGSVPGFAYNPSLYAYNYETRTYDYDYATYGYSYQSSQSYSPSIFF